MNRFRNWLQNKMRGRNGPDDLARVSSTVGCIVLLVSLLLPAGGVQVAVSLLGVAAVVYSYARVFSRNVYRRQQENTRYIYWRAGIRRRFTQWRRRSQAKEYRFFRCEGCRTMTRVPRGHGRIQITCPACGRQFIRKS